MSNDTCANLKNIVTNDNIIFVPGACNGAFYDFNKNRLFSVNSEAKSFIITFVKHKKAHTTEELNYLSLLKKENLIDENSDFREYIPKINSEIKLNSVWLEVTERCNLRCIHCYEGNQHVSTKDALNFDDQIRILKELSDVGCSNIKFIGGEPTCSPNLIDLIETASTLKFKSISIFTNATNISDALLTCLKNNRVKVNVSLYGHNSTVHDRITKIAGSFNKTINNIKNFSKSNIDVTVLFSVMQENEDALEKTFEFLKNIGVKNFYYDLARKVPSCEQNYHTTTRKDLIKKGYRSKPSFSINKLFFDQSFYQNTCWAGKLAITENGNVLPCVFARDISFGNLKVKSLNHILQSQKLKDLWLLDFSKIDECCYCEFRYACKDCRALGILNGGLYKKNYRCLYHPLTGEWK